MSSRRTRSRQHQQAARVERTLRKQIKPNRKPDRVRHRDWLQVASAGPDGLDPLALAESERVMPRGERERRRATLVAIAALPEPEDNGATPGEPAGLPGVVVDVSSSLCRVDVDGRTLICALRGALSAAGTGLTNLVAVGDRVLAGEDGAGRGVVEAVLPRRSVLVRPDVFRGHLQQVVAANVDQLLIVASWREPALWPELVDRYLIVAERNNLSPVICLNKVDLAGDIAACRAALEPYLGLGYRVVLASALTGAGVDELRQILSGRTTALAGLSGVGKSSLLAAVQPGLQLRTAEVSDRRHEGRHTTAQVTLHRLAAGGCVIDTPGVREFGLSGLRRRDLARHYPEIVAVAGQCRFADCSHHGEPGCAVRAALQQGLIAAVRYHSYRQIYRDLPA